MLEIIHGTHYPSISEYILNNNILEKFVEYFEEDIKIYFSKFSETEEEYFLQDFASYFTTILQKCRIVVKHYKISLHSPGRLNLVMHYQIMTK